MHSPWIRKDYSTYKIHDHWVEVLWALVSLSINWYGVNSHFSVLKCLIKITHTQYCLQSLDEYYSCHYWYNYSYWCQNKFIIIKFHIIELVNVNSDLDFDLYPFLRKSHFQYFWLTFLCLSISTCKRRNRFPMLAGALQLHNFVNHVLLLLPTASKWLRH